MNFFFTAKAIDADNVVVANHTNDLSSLPFDIPDDDQIAGRFRLPGGMAGERIEHILAERAKPTALEHSDATILLRLSEDGEIAYWVIPKTEKC